MPAYNEERNVPRVVAALKDCPDIDEIIVVNDGSTDKTAQVAAQAGAFVVDLSPNRGKGGAMKAGAEATDADILLFVDADLVGLTSQHCRDLLEPVRKGEVDMTVGIFTGGRLATDLAQTITPFLSGQRALRRHILESIPQLEYSRYGVEMALSRYAAIHGIRVKKVFLRDVSQIMKEEKCGFVPGLLHRLQMYWEIVKALCFKL